LLYTNPAGADLRKITLSYSAVSMTWFPVDDLTIEWGFIQQQTKNANVTVSIAHEMTLLREVQRELGMQ
jgi:hypothetical protein